MLRPALIGAVLSIAVLLPPSWLAWRSRAQEHIGIFHDDALYVVTAQSLAAGNGYRIASLPHNPPQTKYPPAYPMLLAAVWKSVPGLPALTFINWLALPLLTWQAARCLRENRQPWWLALAIPLSPVSATFASLLMPELWFILLLLIVFRLLHHRCPTTAGLVAALAFLTRAAALPLVVTAPILLSIRYGRSAALRCLAAMLPPVFAWFAWAAAFRDSSLAGPYIYYLDYFGFYRTDTTLADLPWLVWANCDEALRGIAELFLFDRELNFLSLTLARVLAIGILWGVIQIVREGHLRHYAAFAVLYLAQLLVWNYPPTSRFVLPLFPLLVCGAWRQLSAFLEAIRRSVRRPAMSEKFAAVTASVLLALFSVHLIRSAVQGYRELSAAFDYRSRLIASAKPALAWLEQHPGPTLSYEDPVVYLHTRQPAVSLRMPPTLTRRHAETALPLIFTKLPDSLRADKIRYVLELSSDLAMDSPNTTLQPYRAAFSHLPIVFAANGANIRQLGQ